MFHAERESFLWDVGTLHGKLEFSCRKRNAGRRGCASTSKMGGLVNGVVKQVEGGFVMGLGCVTTEELVFDEAGRLTNPGTWEYKPPCNRTIPHRLFVTLYPGNVTPLSSYIIALLLYH